MLSLAIIEEQKAFLLARVAQWPEERLNFRPSSADWSAVEVFDHLVRTETAILDVARAGVGNPHRIGLSDLLRTAFLEAVFRSRRRVKIPGNVTQILPGTALDFAEILERWDTARKDLASFLEITPGYALRKGIFRHPVGGWMNASGILAFFSVHMIHHSYQLDRLEGDSMNCDTRHLSSGAL